MKDKDEVEWEIVDSLPSERKKNERIRRKSRSTPFYKSTILWTGISLGLLIAFIFPPFAIILRRLLSLWWLALIIFGYYTLKKHTRKS